jgi:hypothetical protein
MVMAKVAFASMDTAPIVAAPEGSHGEIESRALFARERDPIHLHLHRMKPGTHLCVSGTDVDQAVYVWTGTAEASGVRLAARSSAIAEYGASLTLTTVDGAEVLVWHVNGRGGKERSGGHVHAMPTERVQRVESGRNGAKSNLLSMHADSQCPTCQLWLHEVDHYLADDETELHHHSQDEVLFVRAGSMRIGSKLHGPGTALFVAANTKYGFTSGPDTLSFVNFRGGPSSYAKADGTLAFEEIDYWRSKMKAPDYLTLKP